MKVAFISLGCAKNLVNTEQMMALVKAAGHTVTADPEGADAAVLNTCGFIDSAKSEAIQNILELAALKDAGKLGKLVVTGCLSQRYQAELTKEMCAGHRQLYRDRPRPGGGHGRRPSLPLRRHRPH